MRTRTASPLLFAALLAFPLSLAAVPAAADGPTLRIDIDSDHGEDVHLTVNGGLLGTIVRAMAPIDIECDNNDDPKVRALYLTLERGGDGAGGSRGREWREARSKWACWTLLQRSRAAGETGSEFA